MQDKLAKRPVAQALDSLNKEAHRNHLGGRRPAGLPMGALMLAASALVHPAFAQQAAPENSATAATEQVMPTVQVEATRESDSETLRATTSTIGKGNQELRDIPQTVTVFTGRQLNDRNLDDFREVLRNTAGVTFQAGETGEEDVRMRGFSLGQAGDIYRDGMRDAPLMERDTFNEERVEVLKGSASMLFGKGSTGGVVNQVSKLPFLTNQNEVGYTIGTGKSHRLTGDFNRVTGEDAAFRVNALVHDAENWGVEQKKQGIAPTFSWGIGTRDEFSIGLYHLEIEGRPLYNHPWFIENDRIVESLPAKNYYGLASDRLDTSSTFATIAHTHRFADGAELKTQLRHGSYERDLLASVNRFEAGTTAGNINSATVITRSPKGRVAESDLTQLTSDYSGAFDLAGKEHQILAGVDLYYEDAKRANNFNTGLDFPATTVGTPNDGAAVADTRGAPPFNTFDAKNIGLYVQDTIAITPTVKLIGGLRFDRFTASYQANDGGSNERSENLWSPRVGALYQPNSFSSYYASFGTSYNTSGDTYQFTPNAPAPGSTAERDARAPAEKSRNLEIGGKWDVLQDRVSVGAAAFYSEKYNERNTDPDLPLTLLSGKRHAAGMEFNLAGRITPKWEAFFNHTWIPSAKIDRSDVPAISCSPRTGTCGPNNAQQQGDRPALTPEHSGSIWTTYRVLPALRIGAGLSYRGSQNPEGNRTVKADSFVVADAMAEYTFDDTWSARLNVSNLTDKLYADSLYRGFYAPGAPRHVQLTLKANF